MTRPGTAAGHAPAGSAATEVNVCSTGGAGASPDAALPSPSTPPVTPSASPLATPLPGPALRTFALLPNADCDAMAIDNPVVGQLAGDPGDPREPVWLERADGTRLSVVWPAGFSVRFEPDATLYDEQGRAVARAGDTVTLWQVPVIAASGSFDDPYFAAGILFDGGCYPRAR